jgi:capsular exopolysaccharide synthesis family protein
MTEPYVEDEINLRDYWRILVRRRRLILAVTCVAAVAAVIFTLLQPNIYQGKATLLPLGQTPGGLQGALGELGNLLPLASLRQESPAERILAILQSRTLAEDVIHRLDLLPRLFAKEWDAEKQAWQTDDPPTIHDAVRALNSLVSISSDRKTGVITIAAEHKDPELAASIANQYIDALQRILNDNAFSLAKKNRLFIEAQVQKTRQALTAAEETLRQFEQQHKIIALDAQAEAAVQALATMEGEIMAKEVQLRVLQRAITGASMEVTLLQEELQGLRAQLTRLQQSTPVSQHAVGNNAQITLAFPSFEEAPEIKLQYVRLQREAQIQNKLFALLMQQLEQAKIEEARDETSFQVLDQAIPPDKKIKPRRTVSVVLATMVGAFLGIFAAFFRAYLDPTIRTREQVERQAGIPVLATIPQAVPPRRPSSATTNADLTLHQPPGTPLVESYRYLHTRLQHDRNGRGVHTIVLTSVGPDDAVPTVLTNLAIAAATAGTKTLLVDSNLRQPALHRLLQCPLAPGLTEVLMAPQEWQKGIQTTPVEHLHLLPAGGNSSPTSTGLASPAFDVLLTHVKGAYDLILCAAPPVLDLSDAALLGSRVDATCLVLTCGVSHLEALEEARAALEAVQAKVIGAILTTVRA